MAVGFLRGTVEVEALSDEQLETRMLVRLTALHAEGQVLNGEFLRCSYYLRRVLAWQGSGLEC